MTPALDLLRRPVRRGPAVPFFGFTADPVVVLASHPMWCAVCHRDRRDPAKSYLTSCPRCGPIALPIVDHTGRRST